MRKQIIVLIILLVLSLAALFYLWQAYKTLPDNDYYSYTPPPTLFSKGDYKIEQRQGNNYIVIDKVGLTAKVPTNWTINIEGDDYPEPEYWVNLSSPEAKIENNLLVKGCSLEVSAGDESENYKKTKSDIGIMKTNPDASNEVKEGYEFIVTEINGYEALQWSSGENNPFGQFLGLDVPMNENYLIKIDIVFHTSQKTLCSPIWEEFLTNIEIK